MSKLNIQLFGQLEMRLGDEHLRPFPTKKSKSLFAFLVTNQGRAFPREVLAGMFWGDQPDRSARKCLRTAIWRVRATVEPPGTPGGTFLTDRDHALSFNPSSDVSVDVAEFERRIGLGNGAVGDADSPFIYRSLQDAVRLYRAVFLDGVYDDWVLRERDRLTSLLIDTLARLVELCEKRRDWPGAIMWCERLLASDSLRENVYRDLMRFYSYVGNRPAAIRCFEQLCRTLKSELGVSPMRETVALYDAIRTERGAPGSTHDDVATPAKLKFTAPVVRPLVLLQEHAGPVPAMIPATATQKITVRPRPY